jgi:hypothetical protein
MRPRTEFELPKSEMVEGPEAWKRFDGAMRKVIAVSHAEIQRRIAQQRVEAAKHPNRRGPKPKRKEKAPKLP